MSDHGSHDHIMAGAERLKALGETEPRLARDPVNQPMVNNWLEAIGETDPRFTDGEAPPAMAQVWTMYGLNPERPAGDPLHGAMQLLDEAGFTSVLGTNCDQTYERYVRVGERVSVTTALESVVGPKQTGVGEGYFVTSHSTWRVGDEQVATMLFRVLKFKPKPKSAASPSSGPVRPVRNRDTDFFWEGTAVGELRIQSCNACGVLRHPPGPLCPVCHAADRGFVVSPGRGHIYSYVTHHAPQIPGKELPLLLAVVELEEGVRMVGEVRGADGEVEVGTQVQVEYDRIDDDLTMPVWRKM